AKITKLLSSEEKSKVVHTRVVLGENSFPAKVTTELESKLFSVIRPVSYPRATKTSLSPEHRVLLTAIACTSTRKSTHSSQTDAGDKHDLPSRGEYRFSMAISVRNSTRIT